MTRNNGIFLTKLHKFYCLKKYGKNQPKYLSITNKMHYTIFITINALHVSGGSSAPRQELKTVYTSSGIFRAFTASYRLHG